MKLRVFLSIILCSYVLFAISSEPSSVSSEETQQSVSAPSNSSKKEDVRCIAITQSGKQCKRKATAESEFCKQHQKIDEKKRKNNERLKTIRDGNEEVE